MSTPYSSIQIHEVVHTSKKWDPRQSAINNSISYIDISSVNRETKCIDEVIRVRSHEAPSRARQLVESSDVLVSTVRPNLNAVAYVTDEFNGATASTGFTVLRAKKNRLHPRYLYYWVRSPNFINCMVQRAAGASYPAVSDSIVKESTIPLPPLPEQKRIATILDKADVVRRKRQEAIRLTEEFLRSVFLDMFGDPVTNPKGWEVKRLDALCEKVIDCPHSTPNYTDRKTDYACVRSSDIQNGYFDWSATKYLDKDEFTRRIVRLRPRKGDIVYCREGARFGNAARIPNENRVCLGQRMMLFRPKMSLATSSFLWFVLNSRNFYIRAVNFVGGSASPHMNVKDIRAFSVPIPPIELQHHFEDIVDRLDSIRSKYHSSVEAKETLFNSLVQRAFRGELR